MIEVDPNDGFVCLDGVQNFSGGFCPERFVLAPDAPESLLVEIVNGETSGPIGQKLDDLFLLDGDTVAEYRLVRVAKVKVIPPTPESLVLVDE